MCSFASWAHHCLEVEYVAKYGLLCALELRLEAGRTSVGRGKSKAADEAAWRTECGRLGDSSVDRPPEFNLGHRGSWTAALAHWPLFIRKLCRAGFGGPSFQDRTVRTRLTPEVSSSLQSQAIAQRRSLQNARLC